MPASRRAVTRTERWLRGPGFLGCFLVAGCMGASDVGSWALADGTLLRELVPGRDTAVLLLADPGECFTCGAAVGEWATLRAAGEVRLHLVLTREPTTIERKQLAAFRLPVTGILARSMLRRRVHAMEYLFVGGAPVMAAPLRDGRHSSVVVRWARARRQQSEGQDP
jgi:hypothetical protein